jgi:hypothetical protein
MFKEIKPDGADLSVTLKSGAEFKWPVTLDCTIQREGVIRTATITFTPVKNGQKGDIGYTGPIQRVFYDALVNGQEYRNDSDSSTAMGVRIQDVVLIECKDATSGYLAFFCINTFTYENDEGKDLTFEGMNAEKIRNEMLQTFKEGRICFAEVGINYSSAFFTQLIARNANVRMLSGAEIVMLDEGNNVVAGVSNAGQTGYHFWSGNADPNEASFSVNENGHLVAKGADIQGTVKVNSLYYGNLLTKTENFYNLDPTKDDSTIVVNTGSYTLPDSHIYTGISYKFIQPNASSAAFRIVIKVIASNVFWDTDYPDIMGWNTLTLEYGAIEIVSIDEVWYVIRYGGASVKYSNT